MSESVVASGPTEMSESVVTSGPADQIQMVKELNEVRERILEEVGKVIIGQKDVLRQVITAFFAGQHSLVEGMPGLAKTLMVHTLAETMSLKFKRIQFTPDLMPADIIGAQILEEDPETGRRTFEFKHGPVFANVLLADEINRTPPKTQAALLEAMQERQVTASGATYELPKPFLLLATQNPLEQAGTYPLPEAQKDRFLFMILIDYPEYEEERSIFIDTTSDVEKKVEEVVDAEAILRYQHLVRQIPVPEHVADYATRLVRATRPKSDESPDFIKNWLHVGCGPRAGQSLLLAAKAHCALHGRFSMSLEDIKMNIKPIMRHRIILNFSAVSEGLDADAILDKLLECVPDKI